MLEIIKLILSHEEKCVVVCVMKTKCFFLKKRESFILAVTVVNSYGSSASC